MASTETESLGASSQVDHSALGIRQGESLLSEGNSISDSQDVLDLDACVERISQLLQRSEKKRTSRDPHPGVSKTPLAALLVLPIINVAIRRILEVNSEDKEEARRLLKEMLFMVELVKKCQETSPLKERMQHEIRNANELIIKAARTCCAQLESSIFDRFFNATHDKNKLKDIREQLNVMYGQFNAKMGVNVLSAIDYEMRPGLLRDFLMHAVGLEESVKEVIDVLELESEKRALAVVLHGVRGMGKTTLADAVFSRVSFQGCKYSRIKLFENRESIPNITDLQTLILKDLTESRKIAEIRKPEEGQRELAEILKKVPAFIYIDNVVREDELRQLLPEDLSSAKKVRLLITARNSIVGRACRLNTRPIMYPMKGLSNVWAMTLFNQELFDDMKGKLNTDQLNHILDICNGNPLMLIKVAKALCFDEGKRNIFVLKSINRRSVVEGGKNKEKIQGS